MGVGFGQKQNGKNWKGWALETKFHEPKISNLISSSRKFAFSLKFGYNIIRVRERIRPVMD
jgi:hypothetical protein